MSSCTSVSNSSSRYPSSQLPLLDMYNNEYIQKNNYGFNLYVQSLYKKIKDDPKQLAEVVDTLKRLDDSDISVSHLLYIEILDDHFKTSDSTSPCPLLVDTLAAFNCYKGFVDLIVSHPYSYANGICLLGNERNCTVRDAVFNELVSTEEWKEQLENILIAIQDNPFGADSNQPNFAHYYSIQLAGLNNEKKKDFIAHMARSERIDCFAYVLYTLDEELLDFALREFNPFRSEECGYRVLTTHLSNPIPFNASRPIFRKILEICRAKNLMEILFSNFFSLTTAAQAHFLIFISEEESKCVIENCAEFDHLYYLLDQIFAIDINYSVRKNFFKCIYSHCEKNNKATEFIHLLNKHRSIATPYLLVALSEEKVTGLLTKLDPFMRMSLFSHCKPSGLMLEVLQDLLTQYSLCKTLLWMLPFGFSNVQSVEGQWFQVSESMTIISALSLIFEFNEETGSSLYLIDKIPPLFLSIACQDKEILKGVLRCAKHLTDEQLQFVIMSLSNLELFDCIEFLVPRLKSHQYSQILNILSAEQIHFYSIKKFESVIARFEDFKIDLSNLLNELEEIEELESLSEKKIQDLYNKAYQLRFEAYKIVDENTLIFNQYLICNYYILNVHSHDFQNVLNQIESKRSLIANENSYFFARLAVIEKKMKKEVTDFVL